MAHCQLTKLNGQLKQGKRKKKLILEPFKANNPNITDNAIRFTYLQWLQVAALKIDWTKQDTHLPSNPIAIIKTLFKVNNNNNNKKKKSTPIIFGYHKEKVTIFCKSFLHCFFKTK